MSESVRYFLESRVPELEDLFKKGLFSKEEIKEIVSKRTKFEHKIKRRGAILEDFIAYIHYETELEKTRKQRYEMLNIRSKHTISDHSIVKYILSLYRRAVTKFRGNMTLWNDYISFTRDSNSDKAMPKVLASALQMHPEAVDIWIKAADWEFKHLNNPASARTLFLRGIRMNKESNTLWLAYFRMELDVANTLSAKKLELSDEIYEKSSEELTVFEGAIAISVFKHACRECVLGAGDIYEFYKISSEFKNLSSVTLVIDKFVDENLADKHVFYVLKAESIIVSINFEQENSVSCLSDCMSLLNKALECGSNQAIPSILKALQQLFIRTDCDNVDVRSVLFDKISHILASSEASDALLPEHYLMWISMASQLPKATPDTDLILAAALSRYPTDPDLLCKRIVESSFAVKSSGFNQILENLLKFVKESPKNSAAAVDSFIQTYSDDKLNNDLLRLARSALKNSVPSAKSIQYILEHESSSALIKEIDLIKIDSAFIESLVNVLIVRKSFTEEMKCFINKFSVFPTKVFSQVESCLALIKYSLMIGDIDLCNRFYAKSTSSLPTKSIESFSNSYEIMKESLNVFMF